MVNALSLCSGYGGLDLAVEDVLGARLVAHAEVAPGAVDVLAHHWPEVPNLGDITALDWHGLDPVDVICAGFPCQPVSQAGRRKGNTDVRWLWPYIAEAVRVLRPSYVVLENVTGLLVPWRDGRTWRGAPVEEVLGGLATLGYVGSWRCVRAGDIGAPHRRDRVFIVATDADRLGSNGTGRRGTRGRAQPADRGGPPADPVRTGLARRGGLHAPRREDQAHAHGQVATDAGRRQSAGDDRAVPGTPAPSRQTDLDVRAPVDDRGDPARWGDYAPAVARWERVLGRAVPRPTDDVGRLSPQFVEWMMGLPDGWVTALPLSRAVMLRMLGNGVVPQQAACALGMLT